MSKPSTAPSPVPVLAPNPTVQSATTLTPAPASDPVPVLLAQVVIAYAPAPASTNPAPVPILAPITTVQSTTTSTPTLALGPEPVPSTQAAFAPGPAPASGPAPVSAAQVGTEDPQSSKSSQDNAIAVMTPPERVAAGIPLLGTLSSQGCIASNPAETPAEMELIAVADAESLDDLESPLLSPRVLLLDNSSWQPLSTGDTTLPKRSVWVHINRGVASAPQSPIKHSPGQSREEMLHRFKDFSLHLSRLHSAMEEELPALAVLACDEGTQLHLPRQRCRRPKGYFSQVKTYLMVTRSSATSSSSQ